MSGRCVTLTAYHHVELAPSEILPPGAGQVGYETLVSLVSAGTETARFTGLQPATLPSVLGATAVGRVTSLGPGVDDVAVGDRIFTYGPHSSGGQSNVLYVRIPDGLSDDRAVFVRMGTIALTALRVSAVELGDKVAVLGLGPVGNLCAQLFQLAGADVVGLDPLPARRELASRCGLRHVLDPGADGGVAAVKEWSGGGVQCTVEAVGNPRLAATACALTGPLGEVIWLGSPRGEYQTDLTAILNQVHLWPNGCLTFKGAHEWRTPVKPQQGAKHSLWSHTKLLLDYLADGRLVVDPLLSLRARPEDCQAVFERLRDRKEDTIGVIFDWTAA